jgi:hypothetical protein
VYVRRTWMLDRAESQKTKGTQQQQHHIQPHKFR